MWPSRTNWNLDKFSVLICFNFLQTMLFSIINLSYLRSHLSATRQPSGAAWSQTCACVCCEMSRPLMNSTWSPSVSRGKHRSAGVFGATRDTITGVDWSEPPCTVDICRQVILRTALIQHMALRRC